MEAGLDDRVRTEQERQLLKTHGVILGCMVVLTAVLRFYPQWVLAHGPSCVLNTYLHIRCPFCGMTRDFVAILHGNRPELNPFSWLAVAFIYLLYPALVGWGWRSGRLTEFHGPAVQRTVMAGLLVMLIVNNLGKL